MNYRHIYHAGNFADVFKHAVLIALFEQLSKKDTPYFFLDTHAGIGLYDLGREEALKTQEFKSGWNGVETALQLTPEVARLKAVVAELRHSQHNPKLYPGSPWFALSCMRPQDRAALCELHTEDYETLKQNLHFDKRMAVHHRSGYEALNALLPPKEKRGLVLIDPPYESERDEFPNLIKDLQLAHKKWANGILALWYPIKTRQPINELHRALKESGLPKALNLELCIYPDDSDFHLNGAGMVIINTPWQFEQQMQTMLAELWALLSPSQLGKWQVNWLNPPT